MRRVSPLVGLDRPGPRGLAVLRTRESARRSVPPSLKTAPPEAPVPVTWLSQHVGVAHLDGLAVDGSPRRPRSPPVRCCAAWRVLTTRRAPSVTVKTRSTLLGVDGVAPGEEHEVVGDLEGTAPRQPLNRTSSRSLTRRSPPLRMAFTTDDAVLGLVLLALSCGRSQRPLGADPRRAGGLDRCQFASAPAAEPLTVVRLGSAVAACGALGLGLQRARRRRVPRGARRCDRPVDTPPWPLVVRSSLSADNCRPGWSSSAGGSDPGRRHARWWRWRHSGGPGSEWRSAVGPVHLDRDPGAIGSWRGRGSTAW